MLLEGVLLSVLAVSAGYLMLSADRRLSGNELMASALAASTFVLAASALPYFGRPLDNWVPSSMVVLAAGVVLLRGLPAFRVDRRLLLLFAVALVMRLSLIPASPYPSSGDSMAHYMFAESLLSSNWFTYQVVDNYWTPYEAPPMPMHYRPPLFNILVAVWLAFSGPSFASAQVASSLFSASIVFPVYLLAERLFGERTAKWSACLAAFNPFLVEQSVGVEPRTMVAYLLLMTLYFLLKGKEWWPYYSVLAALSYLAHPSALWFLLAYAAVYAWMNRGCALNRQLVFAVVVFAAVASPWLLRNHLLYGSPLYSTNSYLPLLSAVDGYATLEPPTLDGYVKSLGGWPAGALKAAGIRALNIVTSYVPPPHKALEYGLVWVLRNPLIGIATPLILAFGLVSAAALSRRGFNPLVAVAAVASVLAPLPLGWPSSSSVSISSLAPLVPLYTILAVHWALGRRNRSALLAAVWAAMLIQGAVLFADRSSPGPDFDMLWWVDSNTEGNSVIMSADANAISYYTSRPTYTTPYEPKERIMDAIGRFGVDYLVVGKADLGLRDLDAGWLDGAYRLAYVSRDYRIYDTRV